MGEIVFAAVEAEMSALVKDGGADFKTRKQR